jgi:hypothetical protein
VLVSDVPACMLLLCGWVQRVQSHSIRRCYSRLYALLARAVCRNLHNKLLRVVG